MVASTLKNFELCVYNGQISMWNVLKHYKCMSFNIGIKTIFHNNMAWMENKTDWNWRLDRKMTFLMKYQVHKEYNKF